jgi:hypothetical protein
MLLKATCRGFCFVFLNYSYTKMAYFRSCLEEQSTSEKSFGIVFSVLFLLVGIYPLTDGESARLWALCMALVFITLAYLSPKALSVPSKLWFKLGMVIGSVSAPIFMMIVYFTTVVPTGLVMKLLRKDLLRRRLDRNAKSYWVRRIQPLGSMRDQF